VPVRFRAQFISPSTEPSAEVDIGCVICKGVGCRGMQRERGMAPRSSGQVSPPAAFRNVGYDPEEVSGFAFGMGVEKDRNDQVRHRRHQEFLQ